LIHGRPRHQEQPYAVFPPSAEHVTEYRSELEKLRDVLVPKQELAQDKYIPKRRLDRDYYVTEPTGEFYVMHEDKVARLDFAT
jgi:hypothetical protein